MIKIICVGKIKEKYFNDAIAEYIKRINKFTRVEIVELNYMNNGEPEKCINSESLKIIEKIKPKDYVIALDINGKSYDSIEFSKLIKEKQETYQNIVFIIGGSYGLSDKLKNSSHDRISFSKMTFPHQMFRVILLEQIYRTYKILNNEEYHK